MAQKFGLFSISLGLFFLLEIVSVLGSSPEVNKNQAKISADIREIFNRETDPLGKASPVEVIVELDCFTKNGRAKSIDNANFNIRSLVGKMREKARNPKESRSRDMTRLANELQEEMTKELRPVVNVLDQWGIPYESLWSAGYVHIPEATREVVEKIAEIDEVVRVRLPFNIPRPKPPSNFPPNIGKKDTTWNLKQMNARCSEITCLGEGMTVGIIDTGARTTHEEIRHNWMGMPYGFYDGGSPIANCTPRDEAYHGTFCTGLAVGANVGVAPKAKWLVCAAGDDYYTDAALLKCGQFMFCPWKCNDTTATKVTKDCSKRPDVINNSWGTSTITDDFYYPLLQLWNAVGIVSVFTSGNSGPTCTSSEPPGSYDIALSVGATDINVTLPYFSSVGPTLWRRPLTVNSTASGTCKRDLSSKDPEGVLCQLIKPDVVGPGAKINSSVSDSNTAYGVHSGTSATAPQVAGVVALMKCANPYLRWDYKLAYKLLTTTADTSRLNLQNVPDGQVGHFAVDSNLLCNVLLSKIPCNKYPNNLYGHGLVDACGAVRAARMEILNTDELINHFDA